MLYVLTEISTACMRTVSFLKIISWLCHICLTFLDRNIIWLFFMNGMKAAFYDIMRKVEQNAEKMGLI